MISFFAIAANFSSEEERDLFLKQIRFEVRLKAVDENERKCFALLTSYFGRSLVWILKSLATFEDGDLLPARIS